MILNAGGAEAMVPHAIVDGEAVTEGETEDDCVGFDNGFDPCPTMLAHFQGVSMFIVFRYKWC